MLVEMIILHSIKLFFWLFCRSDLLKYNLLLLNAAVISFNFTATCCLSHET
jgi:hypothetical protein